MKTRLFIPTVVLAASALLATAAYGAAPPVAKNGSMLVSADGMTLYIFDKDAAGSGKSACSGPCATTWPPLTAENGDKPMGDFSVIVREDGAQQWAYKGKPLYMYKMDQKPGDHNGDNFKNVWHAVKN